MKSTLQSARPAVGRLVCTYCGLVAQPGSLGWRSLTAVSHAGPTVAAERAGHEVALDLCRGCMRDVLKAALGIRQADPAVAAFASAASQRIEEPRVPVEAIRSMADAEAFIRASNARLEAWRRAEPGADQPHGTGCV